MNKIRDGYISPKTWAVSAFDSKQNKAKTTGRFRRKRTFDKLLGITDIFRLDLFFILANWRHYGKKR